MQTKGKGLLRNRKRELGITVNNSVNDSYLRISGVDMYFPIIFYGMDLAYVELKILFINIGCFIY